MKTEYCIKIILYEYIARMSVILVYNFESKIFTILKLIVVCKIEYFNCI